jgi:hypothetical protein
MRDRATSRAKSPSGRETSFGRDTAGHKAWIPCLLKDGTHGKRPPQESYKNAITNEEYTPPRGWNDPPPGLTGEKVRTPSDEYRRNYELIRWER